MTTILIHGYSFDIAGGDDPEDQYRIWREFIPDVHIVPFTWQSTPVGGVWGAWRAGCLHTYHWAWNESTRAAKRVATMLEKMGRADIVCHSLGSRVAYEAMRLRPHCVGTILTMNGADSTDHARACMEGAQADGAAPVVHCIFSREDDVLRYLGRAFSPKLGAQRVVGFDGMRPPHPSGWYEHDITAEADGKGWGDHSVVFTDRKFHPRWRALLS